MIESLDKALAYFIHNSHFIRDSSGLVVFLCAAALGLAGHYLLKFLINRYVKFFSGRTKTTLDDHLFSEHVFDRLAGLFPAIILYTFSPFIFKENAAFIEIARKLIQLYFIYLTTRTLAAFFNALELTYRELPSARNRPIKSYIQMVKLVLILAAMIVAVSVIINRSPVVLLSGLGAITAILLLVFKDAILGLVASVQLAANDMVRIGDWIEMPKHNTDGEVIDINLTTIKIKNWDNTLSMLPSHLFVSDAFKNWRGMSDSGGRRIKRALPIDMSSVRFCDQAMLERFKKMTLLVPYLEAKIKEIEEYNRTHEINLDEVVNGRRLTNLGTFRAYIMAYLRNHPRIRQDMTFLVRQLEPGPDGAKLEIYVFSADTAWAVYEGIQADIFDHLYAVAPEFGLRLAQRPLGGDVRAALGAGQSLL